MRKNILLLMALFGFISIFAFFSVSTLRPYDTSTPEKQGDEAVEEEEESRSGLPKEDVKAIMEVLKDIKKQIEEEGIKSVTFPSTTGKELLDQTATGYGIELDVIEIEGKKEKVKSYMRIPPDLRKLDGKPAADVYILTASPVGVLQYWVLTFDKKGEDWETVDCDIRFVRNNFYKPSSVKWEPYLFSNLNVKRDQVEFKMQDGKLLVGKVMDNIVAIFALGEGKVHYTPPPYDKNGLEKFGEMQRYQLKRFTEKEEMDQRVSELYFYSTPNELRKIVQSVKPRPITDADEAAYLKEDAEVRYEDRLEYVDDMGMSKFRIISREDDDKFMWFPPEPEGTPSKFMAMFKTRDWEWLTYLYDPDGFLSDYSFFQVEETGLTQQGKYKLSDYNRLEIWQMFHQKADRDGMTRREITNKDKDIIDITYLKSEPTIKPHSYDYSNKTDVTFLPLKNDVDTVKFVLGNQLGVRELRDENDVQLLPIRYGRQIVVPLDKSLMRGQEYTWSWSVAGDIISQWQAGLFVPLNTWAWMPQYGYLKPAVVELTVKVPKEYLTSAVGELLEEKIEGDYYVSHWKSSRPIILPGFCFGKYHRIVDETTVPGVKLYSYNTSDNLQFIYDPAMFNAFNIKDDGTLGVDRFGNQKSRARQEREKRYYTGIAYDITLNLSPKKYLELAGNVVNFYSNIYAPYPYKKLALTQMLYEAGFGQGMPGFLILAGFSYMSPAQKAFFGIGFMNFNWADTFIAHEISHQWWGHLIPWRTPRDQWLSEAFAQISCAEYGMAQNGLDEYISQMNWWEGLAKLYDDRGPIALGGWQLADGYAPMIYYKGPYILHMLKTSFPNTKNFYKLLANFCKYKPYRPNTTEDFQFVVEKSLGQKGMQALFGTDDMEWFFDQWIYSHGIPKFIFDYDITSDGGKYVANVNIEQQRVKFRVPIKIWAHFDGGKKWAYRVIVDKENNKFQIPLVDNDGKAFGKPDKLVLNEYKAVLCDIEER